MRQCALLAVAFTLVAPSFAGAQVTLSVLGLESIDTPDDAATSVTLALRQRVSQAKQARQVQGKPIVELKLVFGCLEEAPACMAQIGSSLGTEKLIYGSVRKGKPGHYAVTLKLFDVARQRIEAEELFQLPRTSVREGTLRDLVDKWFTTLTGFKLPGALRITTSVADSRIFIDNRSVGISSGLAPVIVPDLEAGPHNVRVEHKGYRRFVRTVQVSPGEATEVNATLDRDETLEPVVRPEPLAPLRPEPPAEQPGRASRIAFWLTAAGTVAAWGVTGYAVWKMHDLERQKNDQLSVQCPADPGLTAEEYATAHPYCVAGVTNVCEAAKAYSATNVDHMKNKYLVDICNTGIGWAHATWVLFPVAGLLTAAAGYFAWTGYISPSGSPKERPLSSRLRLTPAFSPQGASMAAELRF
jgi:hypothetical protein